MRKFPWIIAALTSACCVAYACGAHASRLHPRPAGRSSADASVRRHRLRSSGSRMGIGANLQPGGLPGPPPTVALDSQDVRGILGSEVRSATDEDMGRSSTSSSIAAGDARAAVIDFGGFLGVGSRKIAIDWSAMRVQSEPDHVTLDLTRDQVKAAPAYEAGKQDDHRARCIA